MLRELPTDVMELEILRYEDNHLYINFQLTHLTLQNQIIDCLHRDVMGWKTLNIYCKP